MSKSGKQPEAEPKARATQEVNQSDSPKGKRESEKGKSSSTSPVALSVTKAAPALGD